MLLKQRHFFISIRSEAIEYHKNCLTKLTEVTHVLIEVGKTGADTFKIGFLNLI